MTRLERPVHRVTRFARFQGRELVASLEPGDLVSVRLLGTRKSYSLPISHLYQMAVKHEVIAKRAEKLKARKSKKGN